MTVAPNTIEMSRFAGRIRVAPVVHGVTVEQLSAGWTRSSRVTRERPDQVELAPSSLRLLHELVVARADWRSWKTQPIPIATLAKTLEYSHRQVQRAFAQLECVGLARREFAVYAASTFTLFPDRIRALGEATVDRVRAARAAVRRKVDEVRGLAQAAVAPLANAQGTPDAMAEAVWTSIGAFEAVEVFWDEVRVRDLFKHRKRSGLTVDEWRAEHELVARAAKAGLKLPRDLWRPRTWAQLVADAKRVVSSPRRIESNLPGFDPPEGPKGAPEAWRQAVLGARLGADLEGPLLGLSASWDRAGRLELRAPDRDIAEAAIGVVNGWRLHDVVGPVVVTW